jgi:hypothetical protein
LNLLADLQVNCTGDVNAATATVQRIVDRFPGTAAGEAARQRLQTMVLETKRYEKTTTVPMQRREP